MRFRVFCSNGSRYLTISFRPIARSVGWLDVSLMRARPTVRSLFLMVLLLFSAAIPASGQNQQSEVPRELELAMRQAELLGREIFRHDRAAAVATDAVMGRTSTHRDPRVRGWITEDQDGVIAVTFVGIGNDQNFLALYSVTVPDDVSVPSSVKAFDPAVALSAKQAAQFRARQLAIKSQSLPCSPNYNTVVLPTQVVGVDAWRVYLLPGTTRQGILPASGYRLEVNAEGATILGRRAFTKSCIEIENKPDAIALMITHMLDPSPTEIHVFLSMVAKKALVVATADNAYAWEVRNGQIHFAYRLKPKG